MLQLYHDYGGSLDDFTVHVPDYVVFGLEFQVYDSARQFKLILGLYQRYGLQCGNGSIMGSNVLGCSGQGFCSLPLRFLGKNIGKRVL